MAAVLENRTLFEGIQYCRRLRPGFFGTARSSRKSSYFHPREWEDQEPLDPEAYYQELREVFTRNLPRYFDGQERIGMSLTGGLDTRMIMAWQKPPTRITSLLHLRGNASRLSGRRRGTPGGRVCWAAPPGDPGGRGISLAISPLRRARGVPHRRMRDVGRAPDLYLNERAREIAPVRMTGYYGSEVLRGVRAFKPEEPPPGLFSPEFLRYIRQAKETYRGPRFKGTRFPSPLSGRRRGITTAFWRWSRRSFPCGLRFSTTTWSERCFARRNQPSGATRSPCG